MEFVELTPKAERLLEHIVNAENPSQYLCQKFKNLSSTGDAELRAIIKELSDCGYLQIFWADNVPWEVSISSIARQYQEIKKSKNNHRTSTVGDNIIIKDSSIADSTRFKQNDKGRGFYDNHPIIVSIFISIGIGILLMFSFWNNIVSWIENVI